MEEILSNKPGKKVILLGNDAVVRGALEAGVQFVATYPGTPASEIGNTFYRIAKEAKVHFEFSTNEKLAMEAGVGASFAGLKTLVAMKNFGLNVAAEALRDAVLSYDDDIVRHVRIGRHPASTTRIVLDLDNLARYSFFVLYDPVRLVIDCEQHGVGGILLLLAVALIGLFVADALAGILDQAAALGNIREREYAAPVNG